MGAEAYPLSWPRQARTKMEARVRSRFELSLDKARRHLAEQLRMLGATGAVISSNVPLRKSDGQMFADREPVDPGVAVYFVRNGRHLCVACDKWLSVYDNMHAVGMTLEALRGIERWGSGHMVEQAFTGFTALPPAYRPWRTVFGYKPEDKLSLDQVEAKYKKLAFERHPDRISDETPMKELNDAITQARRELD
jgi:hypothetical protein